MVFLKTHMRCNRNPSVILQANKAAAVASLRWLHLEGGAQAASQEAWLYAHHASHTRPRELSCRRGTPLVVFFLRVELSCAREARRVRPLRGHHASAREAKAATSDPHPAHARNLGPGLHLLSRRMRGVTRNLS